MVWLYLHLLRHLYENLQKRRKLGTWDGGFMHHICVKEELLVNKPRMQDSAVVYEGVVETKR